MLDPQRRLSLTTLEDAVAGSAEARQCLVQALGRGRLMAWGRLVLREAEVGVGARRDGIADRTSKRISHKFWQTGGYLTDEVDHCIIAEAPGARVRWENIRLSAEVCMTYWPPPQTMFKHGRLSLRATMELLPSEDFIGWLLAHPDVTATGLNASGVEVPITPNRPLAIDPVTNSITTEDCRHAWSAVVVGLVAPETTPDGPRGRAGRAPDWDWEAALVNLMVMSADTPDGLPEKQAAAERLVAEWFANNNDGKSPAESGIRKHVSPIYRLRRQRK
jgi:hypothetical protein